ncbi:CBL-interacting serine/threonine-protein kinase 17 isoform X2 [Brassica napus]|uniref:CBL-interacting serine/threonine-protein kinase 17 isoform X2 n=1 Tax=Brassica napus TaxID=3708 RepID=UPI00207895BB|nr:CBL-interacting serine/threonine-protein kinase 17 isoform X2 [Brassica napus]XP_048626543.1 CBL-interacting serine/threonine-protein kinase 17 isoform X2 [Brassica napus]
MVTKEMRVGKYELGKTLGEGNSANVKLARDTVSGQSFAVKIIDKSRISRLNVSLQIKREIRTLKVLKHPNVVRLHEVLASKTNIYMVLEYVTGGDLFDRIVCEGKISEREGRKMFQQLIDGLNYCHYKGVFHRDLKEDGLLHTACGSPNYVAPEVLVNKGYDGAASDIWSCGVILYAILTGCLPFDDTNLAAICRKIVKGDPPIPRWISPGAKTMIKRMLDPNPMTRITIAGIKANDWFKHDYSTPSNCHDEDDAISIQDVYEEEKTSDSPTVINAFQLIGMSLFLDLSGLFETENVSERQIRFTTNKPVVDVLYKIKTVLMEMGFCVQKKHTMLKAIQEESTRKGQGGLSVTAEVFEIIPLLNVVELRKSHGDSSLYNQLCERLSNELDT